MKTAAIDSHILELFKQAQIDVVARDEQATARHLARHEAAVALLAPLGAVIATLGMERILPPGCTHPRNVCECFVWDPDGERLYLKSVCQPPSGEFALIFTPTLKRDSIAIRQRDSLTYKKSDDAQLFLISFIAELANRAASL